jgi:hypothetical protein
MSLVYPFGISTTPGREGEAEAWDTSRRWKKIGGDARREEGGREEEEEPFR